MSFGRNKRRLSRSGRPRPRLVADVPLPVHEYRPKASSRPKRNVARHLLANGIVGGPDQIVRASAAQEARDGLSRGHIVFQAQALSERLVRDRAVLGITQTGMPIDGIESLSARHLSEGLGSVERDECALVLAASHLRCGKVNGLARFDDAIPTGASLFAKIHLAQNAGELGVPRLRRGVEHPLRLDEGFARIRELDAIGMDADEGPGVGIGQVLMDDGVVEELSDRAHRELVLHIAMRAVEGFVPRNHRHDEGLGIGQRKRVSRCELAIFPNGDVSVPLEMHDPYGALREGAELPDVSREEDGSQIRYAEPSVVLVSEDVLIHERLDDRALVLRLTVSREPEIGVQIQELAYSCEGELFHRHGGFESASLQPVPKLAFVRSATSYAHGGIALADEGAIFERHRLTSGRIYGEDDETTDIHLDDREVVGGVWNMVSQPRLEELIAVSLLLVGVEGGADEIVRGIVYAPNQIAL